MDDTLPIIGQLFIGEIVCALSDRMCIETISRKHVILAKAASSGIEANLF
jgi:hypothetical protein